MWDDGDDILGEITMAKTHIVKDGRVIGAGTTGRQDEREITWNPRVSFEARSSNGRAGQIGNGPWDLCWEYC